MEQNQGLPELNGTEKQIAWANTIRQKAIEAMDDELKQVTKNRDLGNEFKKWIIEAHTQAGWWIDNRIFFEPKYGNVFLNAVKYFGKEYPPFLMENK